MLFIIKIKTCIIIDLYTILYIKAIFYDFSIWGKNGFVIDDEKKLLTSEILPKSTITQ